MSNLNSIYEQTIAASFPGKLPKDVQGIMERQRALAIKAVARSVILALTGVRETSIRMPSREDDDRCVSTLPRSACFASGAGLSQMKQFPSRYLEMICSLISGPAALYMFMLEEHVGDLGYSDIYEAREYCQIFGQAHDVQEMRVLTACAIETECMLGEYSGLIEDMAERLLIQRSLCRHDMCDYLSKVHVVKLGKQVQASFNATWIEHAEGDVERKYLTI